MISFSEALTSFKVVNNRVSGRAHIPKDPISAASVRHAFYTQAL